MDNTKISKMVIETYKEIREKSVAIPKFSEIKRVLNFNISSKAYDLIYGISSISDENLFESLMINKIIFYHDGKIYNQTQTTLLGG